MPGCLNINVYKIYIYIYINRCFLRRAFVGDYFQQWIHPHLVSQWVFVAAGHCVCVWGGGVFTVMKEHSESVAVTHWCVFKAQRSHITASSSPQLLVSSCFELQLWTQSVVIYYQVIHLLRHRTSLAAAKWSQTMWWDDVDQNKPPGIQTSSVMRVRTRL